MVSTKFMNISTDTTLGGNSPSDEIVASQKAIKTYVDANNSGSLNYAGSVAYASLPTPAAGNVGNIYNVTDSFTTDSRFIDGTSKAYPAGTDVLVIEESSVTTYYAWYGSGNPWDGCIYTTTDNPTTSSNIYQWSNNQMTQIATTGPGSMNSISSASSSSIVVVSLKTGDDYTFNRDSSRDMQITGSSTYKFDIFMGDISGKQDALVSGTNIKTINGSSILGSGDLTVGGLPSQTGNSGKFLTTDGTDASWSDAPLVNHTTNTGALVLYPASGTASTPTRSGASIVIGNNNKGANISDNPSVIIGNNINTNNNTTNTGVYISQSGIYKTGGSIIINGAYNSTYGNTALTTGGIVINGSGYNMIGKTSGTSFNGAYSIVIGSNDNTQIQLDASYSTLINSGYNTTTVITEENTFWWGNQNGLYKLVDTNGTIPEARLANTTSAAQGQVLTLDSNLNAVWASASGGASTLSDLTDTTISNPSNGQALTYDNSSSKWVNTSLNIPTVDQAYSATSTNAQSGTAVASAISGKQDTLTAGKNIEILNNKLPEGYTVLEYIQSSGTQYIDTNITGAIGYTYELKLAFTTISGAYQMNGWNSDVQIGISGTGYWWNRSQGISIATANTIYVTKLVLGSSTASLYVDDVLQVTSSLSGNYNTKPFYISGANTGSGANFVANEKIYYLKVTNSEGKVIAYFVPAKRNSDNAIGMYDTVNNSFRPNIGSGIFVGGDNVANPTVDINAIVPTVTSTYSATGTDAVNGTAVASAISGKQDTLTAGSNITITSNTISATDTTYSAGTGLSLSGTTFNHSNSVTAGTAGTSSATSGSTLAVPYITYDAQGHITATGTHTHTVSGFLTSSDVTSTYSSTGTAPVNGTAVASAISGKQDTLVSGTSIKTINSTSLLGSGNIAIDGLPSQTGNSGKFLTTNGSSASWATVSTGATTLSGLTDTTITSPSNGQTLVYDSSSSKWVNQTPASGGFNYAGSVAYASLPTPAAGNVGNVYNVTDAFTTDSRFIDGTSKTYPAGTDVMVVEDIGTVTTTYYAWKAGTSTNYLYTLSATPSVNDTLYRISNGVATVETGLKISEVSSNSIETINTSGTIKFTDWGRYSTGDTTASGTITGYFFDIFMGDMSGYQTTSNLVTSVSSASTDTQYPSAKLFYDTCGDIESLINAL